VATDRESLRVFISYARADASAFAQELQAGLEAAGFDAFLDREDIAVGEDWEARLANLLQQADTVVYVLTPASVQSPRCGWEVERARELSKRLVPVVAMDVPEAETPPELRRLNYVFFNRDRPFGVALRELSRALRTDLAWIREHTRLGELAGRWRAKGQPAELLLRGAEVDDAAQWMTLWRSPAPEVTDAQRQFIAASEHATRASVTIERSRLEAIARANRRGSVLLAALCALTLGGALWGADTLRRLRAVQDRQIELIGEGNEQRKALTAQQEALEAARLEARALEEDLNGVSAQLAQLRTGGWRVNIFHCGGDLAAQNLAHARAIEAALLAERDAQADQIATGKPTALRLPLGAITLRPLLDATNNLPQYLLNDDAVRADASPVEKGGSKMLRAFLAQATGVTLGDQTTHSKTEFYLSVFLCKGARPVPNESYARAGGVSVP
jgi:TIR domain